MRKTKKKDTPGQRLWLSLFRGECYDQEADKLCVANCSAGSSPEHVTKRWLMGMSIRLKTNFSVGLRTLREELTLTQQQLANMADLTVTAVAMIERGERAPNLDTAARLCWALDAAAGVTPDDLT